MKVILFCHSLVSCWNHGNAHFLRGITAELQARGHDVIVYEPSDAWSVQNLLEERGRIAINDFHHAYPTLKSYRYQPADIDLDAALDGAHLVLVHEWNDYDLVRRIGQHRAARHGYRLLFHDTHHRALTDPEAMAAYELSHYDGVLAYGKVLRDMYLDRGWTSRAWTWHEAADTRVFYPREEARPAGDIVWIGNWGDEERTVELHQFLIEPIKRHPVAARVHGVRYPEIGRRALAHAGIEYAGWLPNYRVPEVFAQFRVTLHIPRRPYARALRGIPTIRPFEALACGIPMISAPWNDCEHLFTPGEDFLVAHNTVEVVRHLRALLHDKSMARELACHGRRTIVTRHTCSHRVDELLGIYREISNS